MRRSDFEKLVGWNRSLYGDKCAQCGKPIGRNDDPADWEFVKTRNTYMFLCVKCLKGETEKCKK